MLPRVGVHWVKMPVWYPSDEPQRGEAFVTFAERISAKQVEVVGIIDDPTIEGYAQRDPSQPSDIANLLLADPSFWRPQFDHVMTRLSLRLRWWQLGNDYDTSFYGYAGLPQKILSIHKSLYRFGQDVQLGLGWRWDSQLKNEPWSPPVSNPTWDFEQMSSTSPLSHQELGSYMGRTPKTPAARWVLVGPQAEDASSETLDVLSYAMKERQHQDRIRDFVNQMVMAKIHGANGIFIGNPFTGPEGVMNIDGTPGELLLPWRTTAHLLSGTHYLGDLQLPNGSTNHVFQHADGQLVMIVWGDHQTTEQLYLGESVEQVDAWGKRKLLQPNENHQVTLAVERLPSFVLGLNPQVARWRMAITFDQQRIPSVFSRPHANTVRGINDFNQGVSGKFSIRVPPKKGMNLNFLAKTPAGKCYPKRAI